MSGYQIADEPRPSGLAHLVVDPVWPLFAVMFAGAAIAWPWYAFNGYAMGSPTRARVYVVAALGFVGSAAFVAIVVLLVAAKILPEGSLPYVFIALTVWKLGVTYYLYIQQNRAFAIYEYYGGVVRNGLLAVFAAAFITRYLLTPGKGLMTLIYVVLV